MKKVFLTACSLALLLVSCKKDDNNKPAPSNTEGGKYLLQTSIASADGTTGTCYLQTFANLSGKIDNSKAAQIPFGAIVVVEGNEVFVVDDYTGTKGLTKWQYNPANHSIVEKAMLPIPANSQASALVKVSDTKAYLPLFALGKIIVLNPQTMKKTGEIDLSPYAHTDNSPEPSTGIVKDGYFYLALAQEKKNYEPYEDYVQADVAIINIQTDKVEKVVSEKTSGICYPTRPSMRGMMFTTENKDIYIACPGFYGFNPAHPKFGFVCIPNAATVSETTFDSSKSWDLSQTTIQGTQYKPAAILNTKYIGNGKVVAYVSVAELYGNNPFTAKMAMAVLIDLNAKTMKKIEGVPLTDPQSLFIGKYENEVILSASGSDKVGLFRYNPANGSVQQVLTTQGDATFFHAF